MAVALVIGAAGRMGGWFSSFLKSQGYRVLVYDSSWRALRKTVRTGRYELLRDVSEALRTSDLTVFATPTIVTTKMLENLAPAFSTRSLIVEISSVKHPVKHIIQSLSSKGIPVLSIHPMFGPGASTLMHKSILVVSRPKNVISDRLLSQFRRSGASLYSIGFNSHDRLISTLLALPHFVNIALAGTLRNMNTSIRMLRDRGGPTLKLQLLVAQSLHHEAIENEASLLTDSKDPRALMLFLRESTALLKAARNGDHSKLLRYMRNNKAFLSRDSAFASAYERFNAAANASNPR